jgi:hypothetical protein
MVYIMVTVRYPAANYEMAGKALTEIRPKFNDILVDGNPVKRVIGLVLDGFEIIHIWEVTGTINDALVRLGQFHLEAAKKIEGLTYETRVCLSITESDSLVIN